MLHRPTLKLSSSVTVAAPVSPVSMPGSHDKAKASYKCNPVNRFTQQDLLQAAGLELRALQQEGARFVFEGGAREVQLLRDGARKGFHFLQVADFLVLGAQGRALMVKLRFKRGRHTGMGGWDHALDALGHGVLDLRCETPAHARQLLRKELISRGFAGALPPKVERTYGNQQRQAEQALGWARA